MRATIRVLIADDHRMFREALRQLIDGKSGIEVVGEASDGAEAVKLAVETGAQILLLDLSMPGTTGLEALKQLSEEGAAVRTILLTGTADRGEVVQAIRLGARGVVVKDASPEVLIKGIKEVAAGRYWIGHERMADLLDSVSAAQKPAVRPADTLTQRELLIVASVVEGATNKQIAEQHRMSEQTVKNHLSSVYDKLGVSNRLELALYALAHRLMPPSKR